MTAHSQTYPVRAALFSKVDELPFRLARSGTVLRRHGINYILELVFLTEDALREMQGCGKIVLEDIKTTLAHEGLWLGYGVEMAENAQKLIEGPL